MSIPPTHHRFAVLRHEGVPSPHFDFLVDLDGVSPLATWRSNAWPIVAPLTLLRRPDHRRIYLDYEGPISGNRGQVTRVDAGECRLVQLSVDHWQLAMPGALMLDLRRLDADRWQACPDSADMNGSGDVSKRERI